MKSLLVLMFALPVAAGPPALIPLPKSVEIRDGAFPLGEEIAIHFPPSLESEAKLLAADLTKAGLQPPRLAAGEPGPGISLALDPSAGMPPSGYRLEAGGEGVRIAAPDAAGAFLGTRTLLQLVPPGATEIAGIAIADEPRFAWRGMMLDTARHYFPVADIERFIDWLAFHKFNSFHWHLTDDQGWRIEIAKYPGLTRTGGFRESSPPYGDRTSSDGVRYGGFYTQADIRRVVAYAAARHIAVVPEIEMPGHASAAIAAYPEYGNEDVPGYAPKVATHWGVEPYLFAPSEETFAFLGDVLGEVCELFPSPYIHIGGDEAPKGQWKNSAAAQAVMKREGLKTEEELQSWFVRRIAKILEAKGRRLIGWDEIQEGGLPKSATMMVWRDAKWARHALSLGNPVVMATTSHTYFDYYQNPAAEELAKGKEFECIGGYLPLEKVYSYNPAAVAESAEQAKLILGTQAQLWTEYIPDMKKAEYMVIPRMAALAEVAWTPLEKQDYRGFRGRFEGVMKFYDAAGAFYPKPAPAGP